MRRREFVAGLTAAPRGGLGVRPARAAGEPPPELKTLRLVRAPALCFAPTYVAEELLAGEGFAAVQYVETGGGIGTRKALGGPVT